MNEYDEKEIQEKATKIAFEIAKEFNLELKEVKWIVHDFFYGQADRKEKTISVKVRYWDGELVPEMEVWRTIAHEMAHLRYAGHKEDFWQFQKEIAEWMSNKLGIRVKPEIAIFDVRNRGKQGVIS